MDWVTVLFALIPTILLFVQATSCLRCPQARPYVCRFGVLCGLLSGLSFVLCLLLASGSLVLSAEFSRVMVQGSLAYFSLAVLLVGSTLAAGMGLQVCCWAADRRGQIREVGAKVLATLRTVMLCRGHKQSTRTPHVEIPQIMQRPMRLLVPIGRVTTMRARLPDVVATVRDDLGLWQVCGCGEPGAGVGAVLTWTEHRVALLAQRFGPALYDKRLQGATRCSRYSLRIPMLLANAGNPSSCFRGDLKTSAVLGHAEQLANNIHPEQTPILEGSTMRLSAVGLIVTLTLAILMAPLATEAQQATKVPSIGVLLSIPMPDLFQERFREGLRERGYIEGQNIRVDYRWAAPTQVDRLSALAAEFVQRKVDIIVALYTPSAQAAKRATTEIPIVIISGDPLGTGLVASLAHPGGNVTGVSAMTTESGGKCLELLRELLPAVPQVAVLVHPTDPFARPFLEQIQAAARGIGVRIHPVIARGDEDLDEAFAAMMTAEVGAVIIQPNLATRRAAELAIKHHLPTVSLSRAFVHFGLLMSYGGSEVEAYRQTTVYVDRILKGAKPADLPVEQPLKFELVINLKTANALGLTIPPTLLFQANEVIR
jgi:putative tryptophan/tyrosine transport system substrate-binding protein